MHTPLIYNKPNTDLKNIFFISRLNNTQCRFLIIRNLFFPKKCNVLAHLFQLYVSPISFLAIVRTGTNHVLKTMVSRLTKFLWTTSLIRLEILSAFHLR